MALYSMVSVFIFDQVKIVQYEFPSSSPELMLNVCDALFNRVRNTQDESTNRIAPGHFKVLLSLFCKHMQTSFCCVCRRRPVPRLGAADENAGELWEFLNMNLADLHF